jgi:putative ABC transport system permease protein
MDFFQILSTLRRHRTAALLIILEIALTCAIVCNAVFLVRSRLARMDIPSAIAESELVRVRLTGIGTRTDASALTAQDLTAMRAIPGVKQAACVDMVPFGNSSWNNSISTINHDPTPPINVAMYMGRDLVPTFGLHLIAGRDFTPEEYTEFDDPKAKVPSVIITRAIAERLFPGKNAIGKALYVNGDDPQIVVGEIDQIARPNDVNGVEYAGYSVLVPVSIAYTIGGNYMLRVDPDRQQEVLAAVDGVLDKVNPNRIILGHQTFAEVRRDYFKQDRAMAYLLVGVSIALLVITALGVVGLASFWVQQRTRQIGIRRALGATRANILHYFQIENFILATVGIVIGMGMAYAINLWLMRAYHVDRLPASFLPIGAALLWLLGQVAVLGPALRASMIPPAIATRTV